jgi:hypothetical protein
MIQLMADSAKKHVTDLDEVIISTGSKNSIQDAFKDHFFEIYDLWKQGNNILYSDADVIFLKPYRVFGHFQEFRMFNYTQPVRATDKYYDVKFLNYFNCAIRYYPHNMSEKIWEVGLEMIDRGWNHERWDSEQIIYNSMFWSQNIPLSSALLPGMNWQALTLPSERNSTFNAFVPIHLAKSVHFSGSRGIERLGEMERVYKTYGGTV